MPAADPEEAASFLHSWQEDSTFERRPLRAVRTLFYAAYEAGGLSERLPPPKGELAGPLLALIQPVWSIAWTPENIEIVARTQTLVEDLCRWIMTAAPAPTPDGDKWELEIEEAGSADAYEASVARVRDYIAAGDVFQVNIARFWSAAFPARELPALYARLRLRNPAPFSAFMRILCPGKRELVLVSASPERLFRIDPDGRVSTRPIAGTRRRGRGRQDARLMNELLMSDKEQAEHIMLVDLERNDLGRVCRPGSIRVDECMVIERYATVQHIVSNVSGELRPELGLVDVFRAMFPGGTITGCPKIRCMEIIHELEPGPRGPYTGGIGYQAWDGSVDMNILIRTFWHWQGRLHWAAGAGIVADSRPVHERIETEHKAEGLLRALRPGPFRAAKAGEGSR